MGKWKSMTVDSKAVLWWLPKEGFFNEAETGAGDYYDDECRQIE